MHLFLKNTNHKQTILKIMQQYFKENYLEKKILIYIFKTKVKRKY